MDVLKIIFSSELIVLLACFAVGAAIGPAVIKLMKKLNFGQIERENAVESHISKAGTPTIGGIIFLLPVIVASLVMGIVTGNAEYFVLGGVTLCFGIVGFLDDFLKIKKHSKDGLLWYQKMGALLVVAALFAVYMIFFGETGTDVNFLFFGRQYVLKMGWFYVPFVIFVMLAMTNAVNLTDGVDGLCGGSSIIVFLFILAASLSFTWNRSVPVFAAMFIGGLIAFLAFNYHPAKIFMGDTGSLAIGGAMGAAVFLIGHPFMIAAAGLLFVIEAVSVIMQVSYFKITHGKRIFKCTPIHHHFEKSGWSEIKVVYVFWGFTLLCSALTYFLMMGF